MLAVIQALVSSESALSTTEPKNTINVSGIQQEQSRGTIKEGEKSIKEGDDTNDTTLKEDAGEIKEAFDMDEWCRDFEVDYLKPSPPNLAAAPRRSPRAEDFRLLEPDEELLSESESSEEEEESYAAWSARTNWDFAAADDMSLEEKQLCMDVDKEYASGKGPKEPRPKSVLDKKWIGDYVEGARRKEWAGEMGRRFPGRYVPYPGKAPRMPPSQVRALSAAEKARQMQRKK